MNGVEGAAENADPAQDDLLDLATHMSVAEHDEFL